MQRRTLLEAAMSTARLSLLVAIGMTPTRVFGAWPEAAFHSDSLPEVERMLFGEREIDDSDQIEIEVPDIAENGRIVPVEVRTQIPGAETIVLLSETNPAPLLARAHLTPQIAPRIAMRVKLGGTGSLIAVVEADGRLYRATRSVKVTAGGCGG